MPLIFIFIRQVFQVYLNMISIKAVAAIQIVTVPNKCLSDNNKSSGDSPRFLTCTKYAYLSNPYITIGIVSAMR